MTLHTKTLKGKEYIYYQAGRNTIYLGPKDDPDRSKADNVMRALDHTKERIDHYTESFDELVPLLPPRLREQCVSSEVARLNGRIAGYRKRAHARVR